jgi:hypothetical protein
MTRSSQSRRDALVEVVNPTRAGAEHALRSDRGGIVTGWLLKLVLSFAILGLVVYEAGAVVLSRVQVDQIAIDAARDAGFSYGKDGSTAKAEQTAAAHAARNGAAVVDFRVDRQNETVTVTVRKNASTLVIHRLGFLEGLTEAETTQRGRIQ